MDYLSSNPKVPWNEDDQDEIVLIRCCRELVHVLGTPQGKQHVMVVKAEHKVFLTYIFSLIDPKWLQHLHIQVSSK